MTAHAEFAAAVLGPHEAAAVFEAADPADVSPRVAATWLSRISEHFGVLPGTDVPAALQLSPAGWYGVLPGIAFEAAGANFAAAAVAAALGPAGPGDAAAVASVAGVVEAVVPTFPADMLEATAAADRRQEELSEEDVEEQHRACRYARDDAPKKPKRARVLRVTAEAASRDCSVCGSPQLSGVDFVGCPCFAGLLASATVRRLHALYLVTPGPDWDAGDSATLMEALRE